MLSTTLTRKKNRSNQYLNHVDNDNDNDDNDNKDKNHQRNKLR